MTSTIFFSGAYSNLSFYFSSLCESLDKYPTPCAITLALQGDQFDVSIHIRPAQAAFKIVIEKPLPEHASGKETVLTSQAGIIMLSSSLTKHVERALSLGRFTLLPSTGRAKVEQISYAFTTKVTADQDSMPTFITHWQKHRDFINIHRMTASSTLTLNSNGDSLLHVAAKSNDVEAIKKYFGALATTTAQHLLANATRQTFSYETPLYLAARNNHVEAANALIEHCPETLTASTDNLTPLYIAMKKGHAEMVRFLLANKAELHAKLCTDKNTLLAIAILEGHIDMVKLLSQDNEKNVTLSRETWHSIASLYPGCTISALLANNRYADPLSTPLEQVASLVRRNEHMHSYLKLRRINQERLTNDPLRDQVLQYILNSSSPKETCMHLAELDDNIQKLNNLVVRAPAAIRPQTLFSHTPLMKEAISDMNHALIRQIIETAYNEVLKGEPIKRVTTDLINEVAKWRAIQPQEPPAKKVKI